MMRNGIDPAAHPRPFQQAMGRRIKEIREEYGDSKLKLATALGVTTPAIDQWERGRTRADVYNLNGLSIYYDVPVGYFSCLDLHDWTDAKLRALMLNKRAWNQMSADARKNSPKKRPASVHRVAA